ncbi:hypothetical protein ElyMa_002501200 [Elysia marginata]|uniref:Uncharacterized protein n=1 Tax=Elysia marginata TaxID=1093978 RepID=A0AAV4GR10_9GAST|nr:hypothetical protein ElyMa_002501200 [Elysia marginata]
MNVNRMTIFRLRQRLHETDTEHAVWRSVVFSDESRVDSALTMLMAVYVYREEAEKDTKQIALGNTTGGVEHL